MSKKRYSDDWVVGEQDVKCKKLSLEVFVDDICFLIMQFLDFRMVLGNCRRISKQWLEVSNYIKVPLKIPITSSANVSDIVSQISNTTRIRKVCLLIFSAQMLCLNLVFRVEWE